MAALALDAGILWMRQQLQDSNTSFPAATDTEYTRAVNDRYMMWYKLIEKRVQLLTAIASFTSGSWLYTSDASFVAAEVESVLLDYTQGYDVPMERMKWNDLQSIINYDNQITGGGTSAVPYLYSAYKPHGSSEKWQFLLWPKSSVSGVLRAYARVYPTALSGSAVPELGDAEGYWLYRLAAADMAPIVGRPELADGLLAPVPDFIRQKMGVERKREDPKRRPEASVLS